MGSTRSTGSRKGKKIANTANLTQRGTPPETTPKEYAAPFIYTCSRDYDRKSQSLAHQPEIHPQKLIYKPHTGGTRAHERRLGTPAGDIESGPPTGPNDVSGMARAERKRWREKKKPLCPRPSARPARVCAVRGVLLRRFHEEMGRSVPASRGTSPLPRTAGAGRRRRVGAVFVIFFFQPRRRGTSLAARPN